MQLVHAEFCDEDCTFEAPPVYVPHLKFSVPPELNSKLVHPLRALQMSAHPETAIGPSVQLLPAPLKSLVLCEYPVGHAAAGVGAGVDAGVGAGVCAGVGAGVACFQKLSKLS